MVAMSIIYTVYDVNTLAALVIFSMFPFKKLIL